MIGAQGSASRPSATRRCRSRWPARRRSPPGARWSRSRSPPERRPDACAERDAEPDGTPPELLGVVPKRLEARVGLGGAGRRNTRAVARNRVVGERGAARLAGIRGRTLLARAGLVDVAAAGHSR